jgi:rhamnogalacturonan endolyase
MIGNWICLPVDGLRMRSLVWMFLVFTLIFLVPFLFANERESCIFDPPGRRVVAMALTGGQVFLSWRYLASDGPGCTYSVYRAEGRKLGPYKKIADIRQGAGSNFADKSTQAGRTYHYYISTPSNISDTTRVNTRVDGADNCLIIPTRTDSSFLQLTVGDLDGDGGYEYIIRQPNSHKDPWGYRIPDGVEPPDGKDDGPFTLQESYPFKVQAYSLEGELVWSHTLGAGVERGIWYSPMTVWDLNGDGRAEVIVKDVVGNAVNCLPSDGSEHLVILDPIADKEVTRTRWPDWLAIAAPGIDVETYNDASRNLIGVAYLDGRGVLPFSGHL